jgi:hypothetical protein
MLVEALSTRVYQSSDDSRDARFFSVQHAKILKSIPNSYKIYQIPNYKIYRIPNYKIYQISNNKIYQIPNYKIYQMVIYKIFVQNGRKIDYLKVLK